MDLWTSPTDRREPCGPCGQPVDNADALPTACPHSRASRPQAPQDQSPVILTRQHRTTLRRGCLHRPFRTTSASHSNPSQHRPRPSSPPILQAHFRMGLDSAASAVAAQAAGVAAEPSAALPGRGREPNPASEWREGAEPGQEQRAVFRHSRHRRNRTATRRTTPLQCRASAIGFENACEVSSGKGTTHRAGGRGLSRSPSSSWSKRLQVRTYRRQPSLRRQTIPLALRVVAEKTARGTPERRNAGTPERRNVRQDARCRAP